MNKHLLSWLWWILLGSATLGAGEPSAFEHANQQFTAGDFAAAAAAYENILTSEGPRGALYYNLGNSYQRLGRHGLAILAYERARLLTPRDPDLLANLALARKAAAAFEDTAVSPRLDAVCNYLSRNEWSWLVAGCALFLGGLTLLCGTVRLARRGLRQFVVAAAGVAGLVLVGGSLALVLRRDEASRGIILSENATVRLSPFATAESLGSLTPGRMVHIRGNNGDFLYIEVSGSTLHGWLQATDVAAITPKSR